MEHEGGGGAGGGGAPTAPRPLLLSAASPPALLARCAQGSVLDVGAGSVEGVCEAGEGAVARRGGVVVLGTLGVVELADGAGGTAEVLAALRRAAERSSSPQQQQQQRWAAVGGALCAALQRLGGRREDFGAVVGAPGAGVALLLGAARAGLPGLHTAGTACAEGLKGLSRRG